jgi:Putative Flp pilus-assembly TadE/G-like
MVFVALAMVAICAVAALSIDVITLYLAKEEAQRSADAAALAAARVLSLSGVTGDPNNIQGSLPVAPWPGACALATQTAQGVAKQNLIAGTMPNSATVTFVYNGVTADCTAPSAQARDFSPRILASLESLNQSSNTVLTSDFERNRGRPLHRTPNWPKSQKILVPSARQYLYIEHPSRKLRDYVGS